MVGCIPQRFDEKEHDLDYEKFYARQSVEIRSRQTGLITEKAPWKDVVDKTNESRDNLKSLDEICEKYRGNHEDFKFYMSCRDLYGILGGHYAEMMLSLGEYASQIEKKDEAKQIYRDIIITFTGDGFRSYVKKAEFALEDLK